MAVRVAGCCVLSAQSRSLHTQMMDHQFSFSFSAVHLVEAPSNFNILNANGTSSHCRHCRCRRVCTLSLSLSLSGERV